ncbi:cytoplasmic protein [Actinomadura sp. CNU-125]|uniref:STM4015 family protein n=1 Tax=Actinomadura sp. CNU-125 TaxID=1904961 RepID=UPI00095BA879|nr:STM4015 family protein [Actinomadura sp. CNU-125]OLT25103.1 cytoplasmic protein [Actinomadura sp. CNU-125]
MTVGDHLRVFAGLPVVRFDPEAPGAGAGTAAPDEVAWRIEGDYGLKGSEIFPRFAELVDPARVAAVVIGDWGGGCAMSPTFMTEAAEFPRLKALFVGDLTFEEAEISWIEHANFAPIFKALPSLERFEVRGAAGLEIDPFESASLKTLRFESGGLPGKVVRAVAASDLPNLEHLDLWLGIDWYGGDATVDDLAPFLSGERFPSLRHLGLEDAEIQDDIAEAVAAAPVVARLESLSLAMGTLTDRGAEALLAGQPLTHLRKLDLHHHFLSEAMTARVRAALPDVEVDLSAGEDQDDEDPYDDPDDDEAAPYVAVSE